MASPEDKAFEETLRELEATVDRLESGSLSLEESLAAFERGVGLVRELSGRLEAVERRVELLLRDTGDTEPHVRELSEDEMP